MKRAIPLTLLSATAVGFVGAVTLHNPTAGSAGVGAVHSPTTQPPATGGAGGGGSTTTVPTTSTPVNGVATGPIENYGYGEMAVKVTIANGHIVDLAVESLRTAESYSQQLEQQVVPILKAEVLKAQGIQINALSGATYTSEAYAYSIQGALDKLHFK
jgi:uncharacterized protein with FMN-binding domain